jgi:hypothetical protein
LLINLKSIQINESMLKLLEKRHKMEKKEKKFRNSSANVAPTSNPIIIGNIDSKKVPLLLNNIKSNNKCSDIKINIVSNDGTVINSAQIINSNKELLKNKTKN